MNTRLIALSRRLDQGLTEFKLADNARGEKPWEEHQREKRNRRVIAGTGAAAASVGAGLAHRSIMKNYGGNAGGGAKGAYREAGRDAVRGAGDLASQAKAKAAPMVGQAKEKLGQVAGRAGKYGQEVVKRGKQSWGMTGVMKTPLMSRLKKVGAAAMRVKFASPAERLVNLEAKLDAGLMQFGKESNLLYDLPDDWKRHGEGRVKRGADGRVAISNKSYEKPRSIRSEEAGKVRISDDEVVGYDDRSPSRTRRTKAVAGMAGAGAAGFLAGKHGGKGLATLKRALSRRKS